MKSLILLIFVTSISYAQTSVTYNFESLTNNSLVHGQDNWTYEGNFSTLNNGQNCPAISPDDTQVSTSPTNGSYTGSQAISGGIPGSQHCFVMRKNDGNWSIPTFTGAEGIVIEWDWGGNYWGHSFRQGFDANNDGNYANGCFNLDANENGFGLTGTTNQLLLHGANGSVVANTAYSSASMIRMRLCVDLLTNTASVFTLNHSTNGTWAPVPLMQNIPMGFNFGASDVTNPSNLDGMFYDQEGGGKGWLDNISYDVYYSGWTPCVITGCNHTIDLYDTFGDGWNGATASVTVNGNIVLSNITLGTGSGPQTFNFWANSGDAIQVIYTAGGWPEENSFVITDGNSLTTTHGPFPGGLPTWNGNAECPLINQGCIHTIDLYDTFGDGWNGAEANVTVNGNIALSNITLGTGSGPQSFNFWANTGDAIQVTYIAGGWPEENSFVITDGVTTTTTHGPFLGGLPTWNGIAICAPILPVNLLEMNLNCSKIEWVTATELNNDYFTIYHSLDTSFWNEYQRIDGAGNSNVVRKYKIPFNGPNGYYKLIQTDYDGRSKELSVKHILCRKNSTKELVGFYNALGQIVSKNTTGLIIFKYSDGSFEKQLMKTKADWRKFFQ